MASRREARRRHAAARSLRLLQTARGGASGESCTASESDAALVPVPSLVEDAEYAVESAVLGEADVVRLQRRLDTLERRLLTLELRLPTRVYRKLSGTAKRALRRDAS